jgi:hypothetical protein
MMRAIFQEIVMRRRIYLSSSAALGLLVSIGLLAGPTTPRTSALNQDSTVRTSFVAPQDLDPAASAALPAHYVAFDPSVTPRNELFVFLGGFLATPADATLIVQQAAAKGFPAIGLSYPKSANPPSVCQSNPDDSCYEAARRAIIYGGDDSAPIEVAPADSMVNQLTKLLGYLAAQHPDEGWAAYRENGLPRWSAIRLAAHSTGGSNAALIARDHAVARLCLLESPIDLIGPPGGLRRLPPWIAAGGATPADRIYGFRHAHTSSLGTASAQATWGLLGLNAFGPSVDVDTSEPPYNGSHQLTTDAPPAVADDTHNSVVEDRLTPKTASGEPLFAPVWQYACMS